MSCCWRFSLTGWAMVSASSHPIFFWGVAWPHLPGLGALSDPANRSLRHDLKQINTNIPGLSILVWSILANLELHVAGALKHQFDGCPVFWRMASFARPRPVAAPKL
jgi:cytochrome b561